MKKFKLEPLNEVAREYGLPERKTITKSKSKMEEVKSKIRHLDGKSKKGLKRQREEIDGKEFDWASASQSQSQSQGEHFCARFAF